MMKNEGMVKKLEMRKAVLEERIEAIDAEILQYVRDVHLAGGCVFESDDTIWSLRCKRADMQAEVDDIEYALNAKPYKTVKNRDACIYHHGELNLDRIQVEGFIVGVRL